MISHPHRLRPRLPHSTETPPNAAQSETRRRVYIRAFNKSLVVPLAGWPLRHDPTSSPTVVATFWNSMLWDVQEAPRKPLPVSSNNSLGGSSAPSGLQIVFKSAPTSGCAHDSIQTFLNAVKANHNWDPQRLCIWNEASDALLLTFIFLKGGTFVHANLTHISLRHVQIDPGDLARFLIPCTALQYLYLNLLDDSTHILFRKLTDWAVRRHQHGTVYKLAWLHLEILTVRVSPWRLPKSEQILAAAGTFCTLVQKLISGGSPLAIVDFLVHSPKVRDVPFEAAIREALDEMECGIEQALSSSACRFRVAMVVQELIAENDDREECFL